MRHLIPGHSLNQSTLLPWQPVWRQGKTPESQIPKVDLELMGIYIVHVNELFSLNRIFLYIALVFIL